MSLTILVTGFGPFPGAPFNPTGAIATRLARIRRPALSEAKLIAHVFPTSYAAIDAELPALIARHRPQALLMFGLAPRARAMRIETRARNAVALLPDVDGFSLGRNAITFDKPGSIPLRTPSRALIAALKGTGTALSRDAGRYLCNYLCWRAAELALSAGGPKTISFIHIPPVRRGARPKGHKAPPALNDLVAAGARALAALAAEARR